MDNENFTKSSQINLTLDNPGSGENAVSFYSAKAPQQPTGAAFVQPMAAPVIPQQPVETVYSADGCACNAAAAH